MTHKYDLKETLNWLMELGISEILQDTPLNHLTPKALSSAETTPASSNVPVLAIPSTLSPTLPNINTLEELEAAIRAFEGSSLKKTAIHTVFAGGNPNHAKVMLVGEAPGADEDRQGKPFVGLSGQLLDKIFASIGLNRSQMYITNIVPWRPPGNRQPTTAEMTLFLPFVKKHIELVKPKILVLAGGTSLKTLFDTAEGITRVRGKWLHYKASDALPPIPTMAIYHPAYLLRSPSRKQDVWQDVLTIKEKIQELEQT